MHVLLIEPFASGSHAAWAEGYVRTSGHDVHPITLPGRFWRWRLRGSAVTLAGLVERHVARHGRPDVVLVSGMTDVAAFAGLTRRVLAGVPIVLYLHENQIVFPRADATDVDAAMRCWVSMLAADHCVFNSDYHRREVMAGLGTLEASMPDEPHDLDPAALLATSSVVPVGVDVAQVRAAARQRPARSLAGEPAVDAPPTILWNHRWDDDKQPDVFLRALGRLADAGLDHRVILCGDDPWADGQRRAAAAASLGDRVVYAGHASRSEYLDLVASADIVVSVARHEFFGVAMVEAMAAGCVPVLPHRLSYPEIVPERFHEAVLYPDGAFSARLAATVADVAAAKARVAGLDDAMERYDWSAIAVALDQVLADR